MKFVCLGFIAESKYEALSEAEGQRMMEECFAFDDELRRGGHFLGGEALQSARNAVTLRIKNGSSPDGKLFQRHGLRVVLTRSFTLAIDL